MKELIEKMIIDIRKTDMRKRLSSLRHHGYDGEFVVSIRDYALSQMLCRGTPRAKVSRLV